MTQGGHGYFCVGMISLPADDAREACFLLHRTAASELDGISGVPMGVTLALCLERRVLPWSSETSRRGSKLYEHVAPKLDLVRSKPQGLCAACETVKGRWILRAKLSRLARLVHAKNAPLSLFWQS